MATIALALAAGGCSRPEIEVVDAWIPEAPPNVRALAAYLNLKNNTDRPRVLTGASATMFEEIQIHRTEYRDDIAVMVPQERLEIGPGGAVDFAPGGYHLMLLGPKGKVAAGMQVPLSLVFDDGQTITADFEVRSDRFRL